MTDRPAVTRYPVSPMAKEELTYIIEHDVEHPLTEQELDDIARLTVQIYLKSHENENTRTA